jgi:hypothetical protein
MTSDEITILEAALFAYRHRYGALAEHLDLSDDEMLRIFRHLDREMSQDGLADTPGI